MQYVERVNISGQSVQLPDDTTFQACDVRGTAFTTNGFGCHLEGCQTDDATTIDGSPV